MAINSKPESSQSPMRDVVLHLGHNQSGHNGYQRTYAAIKHLYYWKGMRTQDPTDTAKAVRYVQYKRFKRCSLKSKYLNQESNQWNL